MQNDIFHIKKHHIQAAEEVYEEIKEKIGEIENILKKTNTYQVYLLNLRLMKKGLILVK